MCGEEGQEESQDQSDSDNRGAFLQEIRNANEAHGIAAKED